MKKMKLILPLLCIGLILTGCGNKQIPKLENGQEIVASLDGKDFSTEDLYNELKKQGGSVVLVNLIDEFIANKEITDNEEANKYADAQITQLRAQYEAYGQDFDEALKKANYDSVNDFKAVIALDYKKNKTAENYIKSTISDKEIEKYYKNNVFGKMTVRYILVKPETNDDMTDDEKKEAETKALNEAKDIINKLKDGEDFKELAKKHSDDKTTADEGGLYSNFEKDDVVEEFWNASYALKDGEYTTKPVKSSYGYFVISRVKQDKKPSLEDAEDDILDELLAEKLEDDEAAIVKAWVKIREKYNLDIIDSDLLKKYKDTVKEIK